MATCTAAATEVCDQKGQLAGIADGIQLLLLRVACHVHQAMHQPLQLFHLATLSPRLLLSPHQPANKAGGWCVGTMATNSMLTPIDASTTMAISRLRLLAPLVTAMEVELEVVFSLREAEKAELEAEEEEDGAEGTGEAEREVGGNAALRVLKNIPADPAIMDQVELELTASFKASGIASDIAYSVVTIGYLCLNLVTSESIEGDGIGGVWGGAKTPLVLEGLTGLANGDRQAASELIAAEVEALQDAGLQPSTGYGKGWGDVQKWCRASTGHFVKYTCWRKIGQKRHARACSRLDDPCHTAVKESQQVHAYA
ncbi:MAG: hypothetical protein FRX49_01672 [Trebouxia sp. A1-2]|nr:MAG: hypothetical protein FRX49_01672 [Trebouxia sp. A1-2]